MRMTFLISLILILSYATAPAAPVQDLGEWSSEDLLGVDEAADASPAGLDILSIYLRQADDGIDLRLSLVQIVHPVSGEIQLPESGRFLLLFDTNEGGRELGPNGEALPAGFAWSAGLEVYAEDLLALSGRVVMLDEGREIATLESDIRLERDTAVWRLPAEYLLSQNRSTSLRVLAIAYENGREVDRFLSDPDRDYLAHCALMHHGNQSLTYTDVFHGRWDDEEGSGFDEALEVHEATGVPGNFHLSGPLQTSAHWDYLNGDPVDFNGWLADGAAEGWVGMVTSAYAQHIMPFVNDDMNNWAVNVQTQMTNDRYGYFPTVAWVPERVWLTPGVYPDAGVIDALADNFLDHGVTAVILDDDVHCIGYDSHQIHTLAGSSLKVIPRDNIFTGRLHAGDGAGALSVLTGLAGSGVGDFRIAVYADDWEMVAEIGEWQNSMPQAKETYDWFVGKCYDESAWLSSWKLSDAVANPGFAGVSSMNLTPGTYWSIGGTSGYGGANNAWYTHWASWIPWITGGNGDGYCAASGGSCQNYGAMWTSTYDELSGAPANAISEAGWYAMMTNLYETGWHDGMGGPISGWEHHHSAHIKNGRYYAAAAHWGAGEWTSPELNAYMDDVDGDGFDELVIYNQRLMAVIESNGGRIVHLSVRDGDLVDTAIGVDNAYWYGTTGDYNDGNHVAGLSEVVPDQQGLPFDFSVDAVTTDSVEVTLSLGDFEKTLILKDGEPFIRVLYTAGDGPTYIKSGFSPSLLSLIWDPTMQRVWDPQGDYMGWRNPETGLFAGYVVGDGGASHLSEFSGRLMKGDELSGDHRFEFWLYAGGVSEPSSGQVSELELLAPSLIDVLPPETASAVYFPGLDKLRLELDQEVSLDAVDPSKVSIDDDGDGLAELTLSLATNIDGTGWNDRVDFILTPGDAGILEGLDTQNLTLLLTAGAWYDDSGLSNPPLTGADDFPVFYGPPTQVTIDGNIDHQEWSYCQIAVDDPDNDSEWGLFNELQTLYMTADESYLYLGLEGRYESWNNWLIHLDADFGEGTGLSDLRFLPFWERNATFSYPGAGIDFLYGSTGGGDGEFWRLDGPTSMTELTEMGAVLSTDPGAPWSGSELAIPWNLLYGMGENAVPVGAVLALSAAIGWDEELGGDVMPNNLGADLPEIDNLALIPLDLDGDGLPDLPDHEAPLLLSANPDEEDNTKLMLEYSEAMDASTVLNTALYEIHETILVDNVLAIESAVFGATDSMVVLTTAAMEAVEYTVRVRSVRDASCYLNEINPGTEAEFTGPVTAVGDHAPPLTFGLSPNWPNPFNPTTQIRFTLVKAGPVELAVYDIAGRKIKILAEGNWDAGTYTTEWRGRDQGNNPQASGVYLAILRGPEGVKSKKMLLLK
jgi:hypothetical protein